MRQSTVPRCSRCSGAASATGRGGDSIAVVVVVWTASSRTLPMPTTVVVPVVPPATAGIVGTQGGARVEVGVAAQVGEWLVRGNGPSPLVHAPTRGGGAVPKSGKTGATSW